jgi:hypothetical protein
MIKSIGRAICFGITVPFVPKLLFDDHIDNQNIWAPHLPLSVIHHEVTTGEIIKMGYVLCPTDLEMPLAVSLNLGGDKCQ